MSLILSNLRRMLIKLYTNNMKKIKRIELINTILKKWLFDEEEYIDYASKPNNSKNEICEEEESILIQPDIYS